MRPRALSQEHIWDYIAERWDGDQAEEYVREIQWVLALAEALAQPASWHLSCRATTLRDP